MDSGTVEKNLNIEDEKSRVDQIEPGQGRTLILCPSLSSHLSSDGDDDIDDDIDYFDDGDDAQAMVIFMVREVLLSSPPH